MFGHQTTTVSPRELLIGRERDFFDSTGLFPPIVNEDETLGSIESRIATLRQALDAQSTGLEHGPGLISEIKYLAEISIYLAATQ